MILLCPRSSLEKAIRFWLSMISWQRARLDGLTTLIQDSGAELVGAGIVIEKGFQDGGKRIRDKGIRVESLAIVDSMNARLGRSYSEMKINKKALFFDIDGTLFSEKLRQVPQSAVLALKKQWKREI